MADNRNAPVTPTPTGQPGLLIPAAGPLDDAALLAVLCSAAMP